MREYKTFLKRKSVWKMPLRNRKKYIILMGKRITERCREYFEALKRDDLDKGRVKTQSID